MRKSKFAEERRSRCAGRLATALFLTLLGCATDRELVVMQNPATSETAECRRYPWGSVIMDDVEQCVIGYKAEGWIVER
jgi:hypothetical protein